jgi:hypothetical protein
METFDKLSRIGVKILFKAVVAYFIIQAVRVIVF